MTLSLLERRRTERLLNTPIARVVTSEDGLRPVGLWFYGSPEPVYFFGDPEDRLTEDAFASYLDSDPLSERHVRVGVVHRFVPFRDLFGLGFHHRVELVAKAARHLGLLRRGGRS